MTDSAQRSDGLRRAATTALTLFLLPAHLAGSVWLEYELFRLAGGVLQVGRLTRYGGIDYAWTSLAWLPGSLLLAAADRYLPGLALAGFLFLLAGSAVAAYTAGAALTRIGCAEQARFGSLGWRVWLPLLLWFGWLPVPAAATLTYQYTVLY